LSNAIVPVLSKRTWRAAPFVDRSFVGGSSAVWRDGSHAAALKAYVVLWLMFRPQGRPGTISEIECGSNRHSIEKEAVA
jgi:hypothetical protein